MFCILILYKSCLKHIQPALVVLYIRIGSSFQKEGTKFDSAHLGTQDQWSWPILWEYNMLNLLKLNFQLTVLNI